MSFILDALKKSENERQRQSGPALFEVKVAPPASRFPGWAIVVGALLGVNLIVLIAVLLLRDGDAPAVQAAAPATAASAVAATGAAAATGADAAAARASPTGAAGPTGTPPGVAPGDAPGVAPPPSALSPAGADRAVFGPDGLPVAGAPPSAGSAAAAGRFNPPLIEDDGAFDDAPPPAPRGAPFNPADYQPATAGQPPTGRDAWGLATAAGPRAPAARSPGGAETGGVPSRDDLLAAGNAQIPEARLSLHVYDRNPASRFVFLNGQRAREGEVLANGLRVDEIRSDGAVLSFGGARFLVSIQ